jgi:hypothetical protein
MNIEVKERVIPVKLLEDLQPGQFAKVLTGDHKGRIVMGVNILSRLEGEEDEDDLEWFHSVILMDTTIPGEINLCNYGKCEIIILKDKEIVIKL